MAGLGHLSSPAILQNGLDTGEIPAPVAALDAAVPQHPEEAAKNYRPPASSQDFQALQCREIYKSPHASRIKPSHLFGIVHIEDI